MQIASLKLFCDLTETESFTKTAQVNHVTQSAVSQQVSTLERLFASMLIERSRKNFRLTAEGQALYEHSKAIMQAYEAMLSRLQEIKGVISGTIRVATIYSLGLYDLPLYLKKYLKAHPKVNVHVEYRHTDQVYGDVAGNVVDIGLVAYPIRDPKLEVMPLGKHKLVLICHPDHPLAKAKRVPLQAIAGQKFAGFGPDIPTRTAIDKILREHHVKVQYAMEFDNIETVKRAVEIDAGLSIVPESTVVQEVNTHTLAALAIQDGEFYRPWAAIYKRDKILSPAMKLFLDLLKGSNGPRRKAT